MRKAIKTLVIILLAVTAFILKPTDTRAEGTGKEYTHNFTTEDLTDSYFTITGKTTSGKGSVEYNGLTLTTALKICSKICDTEVGIIFPIPWKYPLKTPKTQATVRVGANILRGIAT